MKVSFVCGVYEMTQQISAFLRKCLKYERIDPLDQHAVDEARAFGNLLLHEALHLLRACGPRLESMDISKMSQAIMLIMSTLDYLKELNSSSVPGEGELVDQVARAFGRIQRVGMRSVDSERAPVVRFASPPLVATDAALVPRPAPVAIARESCLTLSQNFFTLPPIDQGSSKTVVVYAPR